jgi:hypothetical protein
MGGLIMLVGAIFVYDYELNEHPHFDSDIVQLTLMTENYVESAYHSPGTQAAFTVEVRIIYPEYDLNIVDQNLNAVFRLGLERCKPEYYLNKQFTDHHTGEKFTVDSVDTSGRYVSFVCSTGEPNTPRYYELELSSGEFFEDYYGEAYSHKSERGL